MFLSPCPTYFSMAARRNLLGLLIPLLLVGCGESTKDAMIRVATQRAQRNAEEAAAEAAAQPAAAQPASPVATPDVAAKPESQPPNPSTTNATPAPAATAANNVNTAPPTTVNTNNVTSTAVPATQPGVPPAASNYVLPTGLLNFDSSGRIVAYSGEANSIGIHDVETKSLVRKAYNDQLSPTCLAIDEKRSQLVVGSADGSMKSFSLGSVKGLDRYAQDRLTRRDREPPRKAHSQAVTAIAVNGQGNVLSTGDISGELRVWTAEAAESINYTGGQGGFVKLRSYQKDQLIFGLTKQKKLVFWKANQALGEPVEYASFADMPTVMQVGPKGKGMAIGDDSGRVTLWLADGGELKKQSFQAHSTAIAGLGFTATGDTLITASRSGEILQWTLPLNSSRSIELAEPARFLSVSNNGRLMGVPSRKGFLDVYSANNNSKLQSFQLPGDRRVTASGFSNDNRVTVVGDDAGVLHFYGTANEPFASLTIGTGSIENIEIAPNREWVAAASKDGTLTVVAAPASDLNFARTAPIDLAISDEAGTKILVVSRTGLQVIDMTSGAAISSATYSGPAITAGYIDATVALLGNSNGEVLTWAHRQVGTNPTVLLGATEGKAISSVGLTKFGQVWTCDSEGVCKVATVGKRPEQLTGKINRPLIKIATAQNGQTMLLADDGSLMAASSLTEAPQAFSKSQAPTFSDFRTSAAGVYAVSSDKRQLWRFDFAGKQLDSVSLAAGQGEIMRFDGGDLSYSILTKTGHLLAGVANHGATTNQVLAGGQLRAAKVSADGSVVLADTSEGALHVSVNNAKSQRIKMANPLRLLALAPDGKSVITLDGARADCLQLAEDNARVMFVLPPVIKEPTAACFSTNGRMIYLAASDGGIYQVSRDDSAKADLLIKLEGKTSTLQVNATGDSLLVGAEDGRAVLLGVDGTSTKNLVDSLDQKFTCSAIAGTRFLAGDANGGLHELTVNPPGKRELLKLAGGALVRVCGDASGERCVAETADKQLHEINLKDGVWYSAAPTFAVGDCLALSLRGNALTRVDTLGNLRTTSTTMCASVVGPEANVRAIATTADGRWLLAADARGKLARWPVTSDGIGKPLRSTLDLAVDDMHAFPTGNAICLMNKLKGLVSYSAAQDRSTGSVAGKLDASEIVAVGSDQTVAIKQGTDYLIADFRAGKLETIGAQQADAVSLMQVLSNERNVWLAVAASGEYQSPAQSSESNGAGDFRIGSKPTSSMQRHGLLLAQTNDGVFTAREDGSQLAPFKLPNGQVIASALGSTAASMVAIDSVQRLWFFGEGIGAPRSLKIPSSATITDVVWDSTDAQVVVSTEQEVFVVDALTTKIVSVFKTQSPVRSLVRWAADGLWCVGQDQRLFKLRIPKSEWVTKLSAPASKLAWHSEGKELVCGTGSGTLMAFDAQTGNQVAKSESGKGELRAVCSLSAANKLIFLAGTSSILSFDGNHRVSEIPISSALQLVSVATDTSGRWLYASNNVGEILAWDLTNLAVAPKTIPTEIRSTQIRFVEGAKLASITNSQPLLALTPSSASQNAMARASGTIEDIAILPDDSFVAIADGSSVIQLAGLVAKDSKQLTGNSVGFRMVSTHPRGVRVAAAGPLLGKSGAKLAVWDTVDLKLIGETELPANPTRLSYSSDGALIAVAMDDGGCQVFDGANGTLLESLPNTTGLNTAEFTEDSRRVLLAKLDGTITAQPLTSIGVVKASDTAITSLSFHGSGKYILAGDAAGRISLRAVSGLAQPKATFQGVSAPLIQTKLSLDAKTLLAVYDDAEHSVLIWKLDSGSGIPASTAPDTIIRSPEARSTCAGFTSDSQYILIGGEDGLIRAWSVQDTREVARFRGHTGPVRDVAPYLEAGRFVSGGTDHSIRIWRFPGNLPRSGDPIPDGALVDGADMQPVTVPQESANVDGDRLAAAREALINGSPTDDQVGEIFGLMSSDANAVAEAKSSNTRLRALENNAQASLNEVYQERLRNAQIRRRLQGDERAAANRFENSLMQAQTNFRFGSGENARPVKLQFADRFLYAARPSIPKRPPNPDEPPPDVGDNGAILSWEYRITQLPSREWVADEIDVKELFSFPNYGGVITVPSMMIFSQDDGSSLQLPAASSWEVSRRSAGNRQLFAVGSAGANRAESEILRIYDVAQLKGSEKIQPVSRYTSYEGIVTAMAFSNTSSRIAFCIRERTVHRLYVADAESLDSTLTLIQEYPHKKPWIGENDDPGAPGITSLAFTPDDRTLVAHGRYDEQLYKLTAWKLNAEINGLPKPSESFARENKEKPFLAERGSRPIRFVQRPGSDILIAEDDNRFVTWNLTTGESNQISFLAMQKGLPERSLTDDGKWLIMGDDRGNAYIYDILGGDRYPVGFTRETEQAAPSTLRDKSAKVKAKLVERPAHTGPVVGVTLSPPGVRGDFPEFAATIGEENRVIVWDLIPILGNRVAPTAKTAKRTATQ